MARPQPSSKPRKAAQKKAAKEVMERREVVKDAGEDIAEDAKAPEGKAYLGRLTGPDKETGEMRSRPAVVRVNTDEDAAKVDKALPKPKAPTPVKPGRERAQAAADVFGPDDVPESWVGGGGYKYTTVRDDGGIQKIVIDTPDGKKVTIDRNTPNQTGTGKMLYDIIGEFRREGDLAGAYAGKPSKGGAAPEMDMGRSEVKAEPPPVSEADGYQEPFPVSELFEGEGASPATSEPEGPKEAPASKKEPAKKAPSLNRTIGKGLGDTLLFKDTPERKALFNNLPDVAATRAAQGDIVGAGAKLGEALVGPGGKALYDALNALFGDADTL